MTTTPVSASEAVSSGSDHSKSWHTARLTVDDLRRLDRLDTIVLGFTLYCINIRMLPIPGFSATSLFLATCNLPLTLVERASPDRISYIDQIYALLVA